VSMSHKAYAFNWSAFVRDGLHNILLDALSSDAERGLIRWRTEIISKIATEAARYPMTGRTGSGNCDVHEFGDFALTRFYDPM
jgi:hypothetical protein